MSFNYINMKEKDVNVFSMLSVEQANNWFEDRNIALYEQRGDTYYCKRCNAVIQQTTLYISMHDSRFNTCAGSGEVQKVNLAYCPDCEGEPKIARACIYD